MASLLFRLLLIMCVLLNPLSMFAEEGLQRLTLPEAFALAQQHNPQLKANTAQLDVGHAGIQVAGARPNPTVMSDNGIAEKTYRAGIGYTFQLGGKRRKRIKTAKAAKQQTHHSIETSWLDFRRELRTAYTDLYYAQERLTVIQSLLSNNEHLLHIAEKRGTVGSIPEMDVLQAEISMLTTENDVEKAQYDFEEARHQLAYLLNQPLSQTIELTPPYTTFTLPTAVQEQFDLDTLKKKAHQHRPEVKKTEATALLLKRQLSEARTQRIPDLQLMAGPDIVTGEGGSTSAFIIAQMELPLFNRQQGKINQFKAQQKQLAFEKDALQRQVANEVEHAYLATLYYQQSANRYETDLVPKAQRLSLKSFRSFEVGKSPIWVAILAQNAFINTRLSYLDTLVNLQHAVSMLERAIGNEL